MIRLNETQRELHQNTCIHLLVKLELMRYVVDNPVHGVFSD